MSQLFLLPGAMPRDPSIDAWLGRQPGDLGAFTRQWFGVLRACGGDVREVLHDGHPTACVGDAAFGYVNAFKTHVNVGFFRGAELADPGGLLEGTGKLMRHVKLRPGHPIDAKSLTTLIHGAYRDMKARLKAEIRLGKA